MSDVHATTSVADSDGSLVCSLILRHLGETDPEDHYRLGLTGRQFHYRLTIASGEKYSAFPSTNRRFFDVFRSNKPIVTSVDWAVWEVIYGIGMLERGITPADLRQREPFTNIREAAQLHARYRKYQESMSAVLNDEGLSLLRTWIENQRRDYMTMRRNYS